MAVRRPSWAPTSRTLPTAARRLLHQASSRVTETVGSDNRQFNPVEANATRVGSTFRDLDAIAAPAQQSCETGALRHVPTDNHDPAAHPNYPRTAARSDRTQRGGLLPAGYLRVIRP